MFLNIIWVEFGTQESHQWNHDRACPFIAIVTICILSLSEILFNWKYFSTWLTQSLASIPVNKRIPNFLQQSSLESIHLPASTPSSTPSLYPPFSKLSNTFHPFCRRTGSDFQGLQSFSFSLLAYLLSSKFIIFYPWNLISPHSLTQICTAPTGSRELYTCW